MLDGRQMLDIYHVFLYVIKRCRDILSSDDYHSLHNQLLDIYTNHHEYKCYNITRKFSNERRVNQPSWIAHSIDTGYVIRQCLGIRRLTEPFEPRPGREIYSIYQVLGIIEQYRDLFTRKNYRRMYSDECRYGSQHKRTQRAIANRRMNEMLVNAQGAGSPTDIISLEYINSIKATLKPTESFRRYANKWLAHGADPKNRGSFPKIKYEDFEITYAAISKAIQMMSVTMLNVSTTSLPVVYAGDIFKDFDAPICNTGDLDRLYHFHSLHNQYLAKVFQGVEKPRDISV